MTEKNIFAYKLFLLLNVLDFNLFFRENCNPPEKSLPLFPSNPSLKVEVLSNPPLFENLVGGSTPPAEKGGGGGAHYEWEKKSTYMHLHA